jgi:hypothetical protein
MRRRVRGFAVALTLVLSGAVTAMLSGSATAAAAPPIVIGDCSTSVQGTPGQPVSLAPGAVLGIIVDAAGPLLGARIRPGLDQLPPIPIGVLPTGTGYITGGTIANAVVAELNKIPLIGQVLGLVVGNVRGALTSLCGVTVTGVNQAAAPIQEGAESVGEATTEAAERVLPDGLPGTGGGLPGPGNPSTGTPGGGPGSGPAPTMPGPNQPVLGGIPASGVDLSRFMSTGRSPMADYGRIPFARPGLFVPSPGVRYGGSVSGYTPQFGLLGPGGPDDGVRAAGHAEALNPTGRDKIAFPVLLAVFALSGVTAALVRTWVLRRAPAA